MLVIILRTSEFTRDVEKKVRILKDMQLNRPFLLPDFAGGGKAFMLKKGRREARRLHEIVGRTRWRGRYKTKPFLGPVMPHCATFAIEVPVVLVG